MIIAGIYSFNGGQEFVDKHYPDLYEEVKQVIAGVNAIDHKTKVSKEKTSSGKMLYSPSSLNRAFKAEFAKYKDWKPKDVPCDYPTKYYTPEYKPKTKKGTNGAFREMDFLKRKLGVEVQFGKYAFMVYNVCAKMTIFKKMGHIDCGIEIVPIKQLALQMSTGVSYFEQFVWDLEQRGIADIDTPVLIIGIDDVYPEGTVIEVPAEEVRPGDDVFDEPEDE